MSFEIVDALIHDQHFAVEAGVGIGKSFGYLVPVLLYNKRMKKARYCGYINYRATRTALG